MRIILMTLFAFSLTSLSQVAESNVGTSIMGPPTMGQPEYPNSGLLRSRGGNNMGGEISNSSQMSSNRPLISPGAKANDVNKKASKKEDGGFAVGPYRSNEKNFEGEGAKGVQAQEEAKEGELKLSKKEVKMRQKGL